jgi:hypothetical protein
MDWNSLWTTATQTVSQTVNEAVKSKPTEKVSGALAFISKAAQDALIGGSEGKLDPEELGMTFVTPRIIIMGLPSQQWIKGAYHIDHVATYLKRRFTTHFMVWNVSEKQYDYSKFNNNVLDFKFPGYAAAPLPLVFSMCDSLHGWLNADSANVVVVHCVNGTGRSVSTVATYLSWAGLSPSPHDALEDIARALGQSSNNLLIPSQRRYLGYFAQLLRGEEPRNELRVLQRVIINGIPRFEEDGSCRPYLQIFKDAKLLYTSTGRSHMEDGLRWYHRNDQCIFFPVDQTLEGDILVRVRHLSRTGQRVSMMRFGFYMGFLEPGSLRLTKAEIDGATDSAFPNDFFVDLVFSAALDASGAAQSGSIGSDFWNMVSQRKEPPLLPSVALNLVDLEDPPNAAPVTATTAGTTTKTVSASTASKRNHLPVAFPVNSAPVTTIPPNPRQSHNHETCVLSPATTATTTTTTTTARSTTFTTDIKTTSAREVTPAMLADPHQASLADLDSYLATLGGAGGGFGEDDQLLRELNDLQRDENEEGGAGALDVEAALAQLVSESGDKDGEEVRVFTFVIFFVVFIPEFELVLILFGSLFGWTQGLYISIYMFSPTTNLPQLWPKRSRETTMTCRETTWSLYRSKPAQAIRKYRHIAFIKFYYVRKNWKRVVRYIHVP